MNNPYVLAWAFTVAAFGVVWMYVHSRFRLPFSIYFAVAAACIPVPVYLGAYPFFVGDAVGIALLINSLLRRTPATRDLRNFTSPIVTVYSIGVIAWPLLSTYLAITYLNEVAQPSVVCLFVIRSTALLGFFLWAARTGAAASGIKPLLSIPVAFWLLFAIVGIIHLAGLIDVDAFWYLNADFRPSVLYGGQASQHEEYRTSGFMGMDKPQLALWSSYCTCIALWLTAAGFQCCRVFRIGGACPVRCGRARNWLTAGSDRRGARNCLHIYCF